MTVNENNEFAPWVNQITSKPKISRLYATYCTCGQPIIEWRGKPVWEVYDQKLIHGEDDLTVMIILNRAWTLTSVQVDSNPGFPTLRTAVSTMLKKDLYYLPLHFCKKVNPNSVPADFTFPVKKVETADDVFAHLPKSTEVDELEEFKRLWYPADYKEDAWKLF